MSVIVDQMVVSDKFKHNNEGSVGKIQTNLGCD